MLTQEVIGQRIYDKRNPQMTQTELSDLLKEEGINMSRETISKIENGNRLVSAIELNAICKVLKVDPVVILEDEEDEEVLVKLFRKKGTLTVAQEEQISGIQLMLEDFIAQKIIADMGLSMKKRQPLWEASV